MLANIYRQGVNVSDYLVSEKLDGVRALWNGKQFLSRSGNVYIAPAWFTANFPDRELDGELWIGRQQFEALVSAVRSKTPDDGAWRSVKFMVFDLPDRDGPFAKRLKVLDQIISTISIPWLQLVKQERISSHEILMKKLAEVTAVGGEGLMLHRADAVYRAKRSNDLLKVKPYLDAEATVLAQLPGKGKYRGMLGALLVETVGGIRFRIGTGFSDSQRRKPPQIGTTITYQYRGVTGSGKPRFASFLRVREEL